LINIGNIDKNKLGKYKNRIITEIVILTDERKQHIYENHQKDFDLIISNLLKVILEPDEILDDYKNTDTILVIGSLEKDNLNIIIKLNTTNSKTHPQNSIMTAWLIRDKNLQKLREKHKTIYKRA